VPPGIGQLLPVLGPQRRCDQYRADTGISNQVYQPFGNVLSQL
jgi:hypothetical protein